MKRWALRIFLLLLLGAIVNVVVAWGCALSATLPTKLNPRALTNADQAWWRNRAPDDYPIYPDRATEFTAHGSALLRLTVGTGGMDNPMSHRQRNGWPTKSMERSQWSSLHQLEWHDTWTVNRPVSFSVPLRPVWPGFAINTVFYAVVLWLLFAAPFALRRWRRIKRGLCPKCAYPVGTSDVCTECGHPIKTA